MGQFLDEDIKCYHNNSVLSFQVCCVGHNSSFISTRKIYHVLIVSLLRKIQVKLYSKLHNNQQNILLFLFENFPLFFIFFLGKQTAVFHLYLLIIILKTINVNIQWNKLILNSPYQNARNNEELARASVYIYMVRNTKEYLI